MDMRWIGIVLMGGFTLLWASWAFSGGVAPTIIGAVAMAGGVALLIAAIALFRRARAPRGGDEIGGATPTRGRSGLRVLNIALFVEFLAIIVAVQILRHIDPDLIQPVIALIVGAHFVFFWWSPATRNTLHLWTTAAGVAIGAAGIIAVLGDVFPAVVHAWVGIAMAAITLTYGAVFVALLSPSSGRNVDRISGTEIADSGS